LQAFCGPRGGNANGEPLTPEMLRPIITEAIARWQAAGLDPQQLSTLRQVRFVIADLGEAYLGLATPGVIWIDQTPAGYGWVVGPTPADDEEFTTPGAGPAAGKMDLLTVVAHELGHEVGLDESHDDEDVMGEALTPGVRRVPAATDLEPDQAEIR